ncbi:DUF4394 domain-containing protein [Leptolyngbya sp. 7M]|uniref:DUF4394 domain-containing protein n=1 Tax=Leptolyngbya sp. 7M TaxID=2812896 RepID=UPI0021F242DA|nr:DUF4394 domain-containing protein [Leptolyngbya sp. 7M]
MFRKFFILVASVTLTVALGSVNTNAQGANRCGSGNFNQGQLLIVGLTTDQRLVCFSENLRGRVVNIGTVSGLVGDTALIGIDYRVQDGELYGVGNMGGVYMLSTATAAATLVNNLTVALSGTAFGVDFNPAADRLRIISNTCNCGNSKKLSRLFLGTLVAVDLLWDLGVSSICTVEYSLCRSYGCHCRCI